LALGHLESLQTSTVFEIWDYLRDALILILTGHYIGDEALLSFLVSPTLCEALLALVHQVGDPLGISVLTSCVKHTLTMIFSDKVTWVLCSPWTINFCRDLRTLLQEYENTLSTAHVLLKRQLAMSGEKLVQTVCDLYGRYDWVNVCIGGERTDGRESFEGAERGRRSEDDVGVLQRANC
jgi:hypothetical protein